MDVLNGHPPHLWGFQRSWRDHLTPEHCKDYFRNLTRCFLLFCDIVRNDLAISIVILVFSIILLVAFIKGIQALVVHCRQVAAAAEHTRQLERKVAPRRTTRASERRPKTIEESPPRTRSRPNRSKSSSIEMEPSPSPKELAAEKTPTKAKAKSKARAKRAQGPN